MGIKLPVDSDPFRPITDEDIKYLCNYRYPFLQIMNTEANFPDEVYPQYTTLLNGWVVFDYQEAMSSSYSTKYTYHHVCSKKDALNIKLFASLGDDDEEDEGGESGEGSGGSEGGDAGDGTIVGQQFETAFAMIQEAKLRGWAGAEIIAGNSLMQFYAWFAAQKIGLSVKGFTPTEAQQKSYKIMSKNVNESRLAGLRVSRSYTEDESELILPE